MRREMMIFGFMIFSLGGVYLINSVQQAHAAEKKKLLRVGVYDSRGIAIAYVNSEHFGKIMKEKQAALEQAKKDGDAEKIKEIEAWGPAQQAKAHQQGFGMAPVHECFEPIKDKIAEVAKETGVDIIVSKWETDYLSPDAEVVDVTMELAKLFNPREKAYQWIEQMKNEKPISAEEIQRFEKEYTCGNETTSAKNITSEQLRQAFEAYMRACVKKDIEAMTDVYDLEYIALKWREKVGDDLNQIREMIKGIVANKPDEFYRMCTRVEIQSVEVAEKEIPNLVGKAQIAEIKYEDWSWTFRKTPKGWKLIEEGVSGETFDSISRTQGQKAIQP